MANREGQNKARSLNARLNAFAAREMFQSLRAFDNETPDGNLVEAVHEMMIRRDRRGFVNLYGVRTTAPARHTVYQWISGRIAGERNAPSLLQARPPFDHRAARPTSAGLAAQLNRIEGKLDRLIQALEIAESELKAFYRGGDFHANV